MFDVHPKCIALVSLKNEYVWYIGIGACSKATWYCGVHYMK